MCNISPHPNPTEKEEKYKKKLCSQQNLQLTFLSYWITPKFQKKKRNRIVQNNKKKTKKKEKKIKAQKTNKKNFKKKNDLKKNKTLNIQ